MPVTTTTNPQHLAPNPQDSALSLPTGLLVGIVLSAAAFSAAVWTVGVLVGPWGDAAMISGLTGMAVVAVIALAGVMLMLPWKARPLETWMTFWLGGIVFRLLLTPVAVLVLYSATNWFAVRPLALAVGVSYCAILFAEAIVLSGYLKRALAA